MKIFSGSIVRASKGNNHILDITDEVRRLVEESGVRIGQVVAMVVGSTAALTTLEFEPGLVNHDVAAAMERIAPKHGDYLHEETWHDDNGHSHVQTALRRWAAWRHALTASAYSSTLDRLRPAERPCPGRSNR